MKKKTIWRKGEPPSIGWWPASLNGLKDSLRWWNGETWSAVAWPWYTAEMASRAAEVKCNCPTGVNWCARWWK